MAIPVGAALGYVVGGLVGAAFRLAGGLLRRGIPGAALALASLWLPDPPRGVQESELKAPAGAAPASGAAAVYRDLLRRGPYMVLVLGYAAYTFALGGLAYWMPIFLERVRHVTKAGAATDFGLIVLGTGVVGTMTGGWLADYLRRYSGEAYLWFSGVVTLLAAPSGAAGARCRAA
jgi:hypothetical protein